MKKITLLFLTLTVMLNVANAQDIIVFDFDGTTTPAFSSWSDSFVSLANLMPDGVNTSANIGKYTHNAQWSEINIDLTATPIDSRYCTSFQFKVYSPAAGRLIMGCRNSTDTSLSEYNSVQSVAAGWTTITQNIDATQPITKIYFSFKVDSTPAGDTTDVIYLDDLTFITTTNAKLYSENFEADLAWNASPTVTPSTKAGKWKGGIDLQTAGDASITLEQWWAPHNRVLKLTSTDAAVTIPNINVAGFTNLNLSIDFTNANEATAPIIEASVDGGAFSPLTTAVDGAWNTWGTQVIALPAATSTISLRINPSASNPIIFDNFTITGTPVTLGINSYQLDNNEIGFYPNPVIDYIAVKEGVQKVTIMDINGSIVKEVSNVAGNVDVSSLAEGLYIIKLQEENSTKIGKLIKK